MITEKTPCPCGSGLPNDRCCGPLLAGTRQAATAEALMRSRYTAYCTGDTAYVLRTWHPSTRPATLDTDDQPQWRWLEIIRTAEGGQADDKGVVELWPRPWLASGSSNSARPADSSRKTACGCTWTAMLPRRPAKGNPEPAKSAATMPVPAAAAGNSRNAAAGEQSGQVGMVPAGR